eukprot:GCRY01002517.1.p1 GENE.GCRY01002517.1~~GCRY01002517.1.p1  ORF type:complete len:233 (-),score=31.80 GCRY01002517.1:106-804(-)
MDRKEELKGNLSIIYEEIEKAKKGNPVSLVAVSKIKPASDVEILYSLGHRVFGENYVQEFVDKAHALKDLNEIEWHFIGHLQSNKCNVLLGAPHLQVVESVDSVKLAGKLNQSCERIKRESLDIFLQVNTSGENSKSGIGPTDIVSVAKTVVNQYKHLKLKGLMTIGGIGEGSHDFGVLVSCREKVSTALGCAPEDLELSMGMSSDYCLAVSYGATNVRVGSSIFGARVKPS